MKRIYILAGFLFSFFLSPAQAQQIPLPEIPRNKMIPQINYDFNRIFGDMNDFYRKLLLHKKNNSDVIRIVHIGDSHIQAGLFTGAVRRSLQEIFGNAGRGIVFPYRLARSNSPDDIKSFSNVSWQFNRLVRSIAGIEPGISGYCLKTKKPGADLKFLLEPTEMPQRFDRIRFFLNGSHDSTWKLRGGDDDSTYTIFNSGDSLSSAEIGLKNPTSEFTLVSDSGSQAKYFYGASLENDTPGIIYHSIGVNGARYDQYNNTPLFWKQLPALKADIFIISLGTNEAQAGFFNETAFLAQVDLFLKNLKIASPGASILITTAADSYKGRFSNRVLRQLNISLNNYCVKNGIAVWDLYRVTNGYGSAAAWLRRQLLNKDRIHFSAAGYELQAKLFLQALLKGYNNYTGIN